MIGKNRIAGILYLFIFCLILSVVADDTDFIVPDTNSSNIEEPYVPGEVIVMYEDGRVASLAASGYEPAEFATIGAEVSGDIGTDGINGLQALSIADDVPVEDAIEELESSPYVAYAEPNYIISLSLPEEPEPVPESSIKSSAMSMLSVPNDPRFSEQWGMKNTAKQGADISASGAWDISTGSKDIIVAVIDSGVDYTHPDLADNIWTNPNEIPGNGIDDDHNGYIDDIHGWDFINNDNDPMDDNGHGTHCAGVVGGVGNNGVGIVGVNWHVKIMPLKFLRADGNGDTASSINAVAYAKKMGANVISCSWGGSAKSQALADVIESTNALFVFAAGNEGANNDAGSHYPSNLDIEQIIAVAASNANDGMPSFSNYGASKVDVAAPGDAILSTYPTSKSSNYVKMKGTSMATPHVAGLAALMLSINPKLTPKELKSTIMSTVDVLPAFSGKTVSGGRINAEKALLKLTGGSSGVDVKKLPSQSKIPTDPNGDGKYEDLNGNGRADFSDVVLFFKNMDWITANEPVKAFDFSGNGRIDFTDVIKLFKSIT